MSFTVDTESSGWPLLCVRSCVFAMISTTTVTPSTPTIQPTTNIALFALRPLREQHEDDRDDGNRADRNPSASGSRSPIV